MEPRPPRPRSSRQFDSQPAPPSSGIGERLYPANTEPPQYASGPGDAYAPGMAGEEPLLPRQQRRQRSALRGVLGTLAVKARAAGFDVTGGRRHFFGMLETIELRKPA